MDWLVKNGPGITAIAAGIAATIALIGLIIATRQLGLIRRNQRETIAKTLYREYLQLAIKEPVYSTPNFSQFDFRAGTINGSKEKYASYEWYISFMLHACEEILETHESVQWRDTIKAQIRYHRDYICGPFRADNLQGHYSSRLRSLFDEVCSERPPQRTGSGG